MKQAVGSFREVKIPTSTKYVGKSVVSKQKFKVKHLLQIKA